MKIKNLVKNSLSKIYQIFLTKSPCRLSSGFFQSSDPIAVLYLITSLSTGVIKIKGYAPYVQKDLSSQKITTNKTYPKRFSLLGGTFHLLPFYRNIDLDRQK